MIFKFPGIERTTLEFRIALIALGRELDIDPNAMAAVMSIESGFRPAIRNPHGGAVGLIQFMPATLKVWGLTSDQAAAMSAVEQLELVKRFYRYARGTTDPGRLYMLTFLPKYADSPEGFVLGARDSAEIRDGLKLHNIWAQNAGLDTNKDGLITVGEVKALARGRYELARAAGVVDPAPEVAPRMAPAVPLEVDWDELRKDRDAKIRDDDE